MYYTCKFANKLKNKNNIVVGSTDSRKILKLFKQYNIQAPFLRPKKISKKYSLDIEYVNYAINFYAKMGIFFYSGCILRPTSPIRYLEDYKKAEKKFLKNKSATSLRSIMETPITPYKMWKRKKNYVFPLLKSKLKEHYNMPRQKLPKIYWQTGTYDFFKINFKKKIKSMTGNKIIFYDLSNRENVDIDTIRDYKKVIKLL